MTTRKHHLVGSFIYVNFAIVIEQPRPIQKICLRTYVARIIYIYNGSIYFINRTLSLSVRRIETTDNYTPKDRCARKFRKRNARVLIRSSPVTDFRLRFKKIYERVGTVFSFVIIITVVRKTKIQLVDVLV